MLSRKLLNKYYRIRDKVAPPGTSRQLLLNIILHSTVKIDRPFKLENFLTLVRFVYCFMRDRELAERLLEKRSMAKQYRNMAKSQFVENTDNINKQKLVFPQIDNPQISVIIPAYNKWIFTYNCLYSLWANRDNISIEVIVVDNCSTDETSMLSMYFGNVKVIRNEENLGFVKACNLGARIASGKYLLFLNNDVLVTNRLLEAMFSLAERGDIIGVVGARLVYPDGLLQEAGGIVWNDPDNIAWNYGRYGGPDRWEYNYVKEVDYCSGACLMIKRQLFFDVSLFDEDYAPVYFEDTDLAFKVREAGYKVMYQPAAVAIHFEGATAGTDLSTGFKKFQNINKVKFYEKWKSTLEFNHFKIGEDVFLARDRSRDKKILLYIDHQVPTFDRDAGSKITYEYLKLFNNMGFKIIFWPHILQKIEPYTTVIQQTGIEIVYGYASLKNFLKKNGKYLHYVFLSRPHVAKEYINSVKAYSPKAKLFYVAHDLHFLREGRRAEIEGNKSLKQFAGKMKRIEMSIIEKSDLTLVFSKIEKKILESENPAINVDIMPWIQKRNVWDTNFDKRKNLMFIGGFIHKPNEDGILWFTKNVFPHIQKKINDIKLVIIGSNPTTEILALQSDNVIVTGYVEDPDYYFKNARIFVAPLRYGAGIKGKIIEAMSYGLPVVTTDIGAEGLDLESGKNVLIANNSEEFVNEVVSLYFSEELWSKLSQNSLYYVDTKNSAINAEFKLSQILGVTKR